MCTPLEVSVFSCLRSSLRSRTGSRNSCAICGGHPLGFPGSSVGKESACSAGDPSSIPELGRSTGEAIGYPLPGFWAGRGHLEGTEPQEGWLGGQGKAAGWMEDRQRAPAAPAPGRCPSSFNTQVTALNTLLTFQPLGLCLSTQGSFLRISKDPDSSHPAWIKCHRVQETSLSLPF